VSVVVRPRFVAISVEIPASCGGCRASPSEDRVAHLSISESSPASRLPNSTSGDRISPRMSRGPRAAAPRSSRRVAAPRGRGCRAPARVPPHPPRLALPTERYRRGCSEVSVLVRPGFVASSVEVRAGYLAVRARYPSVSWRASTPSRTAHGTRWGYGHRAPHGLAPVVSGGTSVDGAEQREQLQNRRGGDPGPEG
jgi:hypothetical protein